jgi:PAS domain-containing protein
MPICHRCGKNLSTQQALDYHIHSANCLKSTTKPFLRNDFQYDYYFVFDFFGNIQSVSNNISNYFGYSYNQMIGHSGYDFIYENDKIYMYQHHIRNVVSNIASIVNFRRIDKDSIVFPVQCMGIMNKDLNEIHTFEKTIDFPDPHKINFILNSDFTFSSISPLFTQIYGYTFVQLTGIKYFDLCIDVDRMQLLENLHNFFHSNEFTCNHTIISKSGAHIHVKSISINKGNFYMISNDFF